MLCTHCGNNLPPERATLGFNYCTTCAVFYTPEIVVVPLGEVTLSIAPPPPKRVTKTHPKVARGRFQVISSREEVILNREGEHTETIRVNDFDVVRGFDNLDNAMTYAMDVDENGLLRLISPRVKDSLPLQEGGLGQVWPTPDRFGNTHHSRRRRY